MQAPIQSSRAQSFDEIYGPPENFLEIEVCPPFSFFPLSFVPRVVPTCFVLPAKADDGVLCGMVLPVGQESADAWVWEEDVHGL